MCGRYALRDDDIAHLASRYPPTEPIDRLTRLAHFDVRPTTVRPVIREGSLQAARWGWQRPWSAKPLINTRSETVADKATFRDAFRKRRLVVPATAYYEWHRVDEVPKEKYAFRLQDGEPLLMAGIWEEATIPDGQETRFLILTREMTTRHAVAGRAPILIHDRTPVLLTPAAAATWMDPAATDGDLWDAASTRTDHDLVVREVVRNAAMERRNDPQLLEPVGEPWPVAT
jgi:putative SOS response-associated peptidase YedK